MYPGIQDMTRVKVVPGAVPGCHQVKTIRVRYQLYQVPGTTAAVRIILLYAVHKRLVLRIAAVATAVPHDRLLLVMGNFFYSTVARMLHFKIWLEEYSKRKTAV